MLSNVRQLLKNVDLVANSGTKIEHLCKQQKSSTQLKQNCVVYAIPCNTCDKVYIGETHRGLQTRLQEHKNDIRFGRCNTGLSEHIINKNHIVDWEHASVLRSGLDKKKRKAIESAYIATENTINHNIGFTRISKYAAKTALS